jgi:lysophospholipase L1-like esterase
VSLLVVVGALAGPGVARAQTGGPGPVDPRLFVIGDSVIVGVQATLAQRLAGWHVNVYAQEGFSTLAAPSVINASRALIGEVVVVGLGNNDAGNPVTFGQRIDAVMQSLPGVRRVIWVNLRRFRAFVPALNLQLAAATTRWPNLEIADWDTRATPDPSLVYTDGLHLTPAGQTAMAELIAQHLDTYVRSRTPASTSTTTTTVPTAPRRHHARHRSPPPDDRVLGLPVDAVVGIGAGALALVIVIVTVVGLRLRRRRRRLARTAPFTSDESSDREAASVKLMWRRFEVARLWTPPRA